LYAGGILEENSKIFNTSDLSLAAFLLMKGLKLNDAKKITSGKFKFSFNDPDDKAKKLALDFVNSEFCEFDNQVRNLKKLIYNN
tara:strand:+ start:7724 stop:7975 length:252 start_codon:yes stop_codon:yes gene_type:complete